MSDTRCERCKDVLYQCHTCADTDKAIRRSLKKAPVSQADETNSQKQTKFLSLIKRKFNVKCIARDGDCLYRAFIHAYEKGLKKEHGLTVQKLRYMVAEHLIDQVKTTGEVQGQLYEYF